MWTDSRYYNSFVVSIKLSFIPRYHLRVVFTSGLSEWYLPQWTPERNDTPIILERTTDPQWCPLRIILGLGRFRDYVNPWWITLNRGTTGRIYSHISEDPGHVPTLKVAVRLIEVLGGRDNFRQNGWVRLSDLVTLMTSGDGTVGRRVNPSGRRKDSWKYEGNNGVGWRVLYSCSCVDVNSYRGPVFYPRLT